MTPKILFKPIETTEKQRVFRTTVEDIKGRLKNREMRLIVGNEIVRIIKKNIKEGGRPNKFAPLAKSTIDARRRRGNNSTKPLIDTGALIQSIRAGVVGSRLEIRMVKYGQWVGKERPFIVIPPEERANLQKAFDRAVKVGGKKK